MRDFEHFAHLQNRFLALGSGTDIALIDR